MNNYDELVVRTNQILNNYEKLSGIPEFKTFNSDQVDGYFNMTIEQLNKLTPTECAEIAYVLAQYAFYIQRLQNRESAQQKWALDQLTNAICDKLDSYSTYTKHEVKIALIAKENKAVDRLRILLGYTSQIIERLNFLSSNIKHMSDIMSNIQKAKSFNQKANQGY